MVAAAPSGPKLESLTHIDISKLSQSELHALSLCSDAAFDLHRTDDVVVPQIDRTLFNESAGSRRQTYSRLRLAPRQPDSTAAGHRCRLPCLLPTPKPPPSPPSDDPESGENKSIVNFLKQLIGEDSHSNSTTNHLQLAVVVSGNAKAVPEIIDIDTQTEEEVLGFLRNLEGQWGSRRKKRKIVDATEFGDALPIGWKLLLGLRRREGRVSVYCRRYVSPTGQHFVSCKEVSSYLQSYFGLNDENQSMDQRSGNIQQAYRPTPGSHAGFIHKDDDINEDIISSPMLPSSSISDIHEKEISLMGIDNLAEVQVRDLFECYKCNMSFDEKDTYLQHLLSFHQRTTRRYRLGTSVGEGVIIKDGKYECQFCHKVFQERRSYNGHVGIHVRNYVRSSDESPGRVAGQKHIESRSHEELPSRMSKMDALIEIAQSSILETSSGRPNDKVDGGSSPTKLNVVTIPEISAARSDHELSLASHPSERKMEDCMTDEALTQDLNRHDSEYSMTVVSTDTSEHPKLDDVENYGNSELDVGFGNSHIKPNHDAVTESVEQTVEEIVPQSGVTDSSMPQTQSVHCFSAFTAISNKGENEFCTVAQKLENMTGFEELRLDELEPLQFSFMNGQELSSPPVVSMDLANDIGMEDGFNSSVRFESELNEDDKDQLTTVCVWCRVEFNHEAVDSETQSDSVGFMCPTCKAKISGQLNVLDGGLSMN
ncbi:hypothetical protein F0562_028932 [Nyssa sinensis]|uniref:C2H2-type domain-containing protein n=1 Tax=Nyssa sinensis TaxID=561372 RepID=A0A5J5B1E3_9ASTE|nr:hypothetical protein F0562_028932 [Nyssa sinensis]